MNRAGFPVIVVSDTSRSGSTWKSFLETAGGFRLESVVASSDVGVMKPNPQIFKEAARRLRLVPSEVLHVGDRWKNDVEGAREAGLGAALYRGLWSSYWDPSERGGDAPAGEYSTPVLDKLSQVRPILGNP